MAVYTTTNYIGNTTDIDEQVENDYYVGYKEL